MLPPIDGRPFVRCHIAIGIARDEEDGEKVICCDVEKEENGFPFLNLATSYPRVVFTEIIFRNQMV